MTTLPGGVVAEVVPHILGHLVSIEGGRDGSLPQVGQGGVSARQVRHGRSQCNLLAWSPCDVSIGLVLGSSEDVPCAHRERLIVTEWCRQRYLCETNIIYLLIN